MSPQSQPELKQQQQQKPVVYSQVAANSQSQPSPVNFFTELGRGPLVMMAKGISAMCQGNEALRGIQQNAAHEASAHHADMVQKLFEPCAPGDLMAMQTELLRHDLQSASKYWQQLTTQMLQTQVDMMRSVSDVVDSEKGLPTPLPIPLPGSFFMLDPSTWKTGQNAQDTQEKNMTHH